VEFQGCRRQLQPRPGSSMVSMKNWMKLLPIGVVEAWLIFTLLVFEFGPYEYPPINHIKLFLYLIISNIFILIGYIKGIRRAPNVTASKPIGFSFFSFSCYFAVIWSIVMISTWPSLQQIMIGYLSGATDTLRAQQLSNIGGRWQDYYNILLSPMVYVVITIGPYSWFKLKKLHKILVIFVILIKIFNAVMGGGRIEFLEVLFMSGGAASIPILSNRFKPPKIAIAIVVFGLFSTFTAYNIFIVASRSTMTSERYVGSQLTRDSSWLKQDGIIINHLPPSIQPAILQSLEYLSHGYYPLGLCLEKPVSGVTFGLGHSQFLIRNAEQVFQTRYFSEISYWNRLQMEDNYSVQLFMSGYIWIANDVTFLGSIFVLYGFAYLLGCTWIDSLTYINYFSVTAFCFLMFMFFSLPMFSILLDGVPFVSFYSTLLLWGLGRSVVSRRSKLKSITSQRVSVFQ